jgi:hypothetical protein
MRPGMGQSLTPCSSTIQIWTPTPASSRPGMTKTCSVKKRDSVAAADNRSAEHQMDQRRADNRHAARDNGSADAQAPVGVLIEAHHLAGKGHAQREQKQNHADHPGELARKFVSAEEKDLHHVDEHDGDHEVRTPAMQRAQIPAEGDVVVEEG